MKQTVLNLFRAAFIATLLAGPSLMLSSCCDETEGKASINDAAPAKVTDVSSVAGPGLFGICVISPPSSSHSLFTEYVPPLPTLNVSCTTSDTAAV